MTDKRPPKPQIKPYLTVVKGRSPESKAHTNIGHAKVAVCQYPKWSSRFKYDGVTYVTLFEEIDGIRTGRKKHSQRICGGDIWAWDNDKNDWELLYSIPEGGFEHQLPWKAKEYEFYVE